MDGGLQVERVARAEPLKLLQFAELVLSLQAQLTQLFIRTPLVLVQTTLDVLQPVNQNAIT